MSPVCVPVDFVMDLCCSSLKHSQIEICSHYQYDHLKYKTCSSSDRNCKNSNYRFLNSWYTVLKTPQEGVWSITNIPVRTFWSELSSVGWALYQGFYRKFICGYPGWKTCQNQCIRENSIDRTSTKWCTRYRQDSSWFIYRKFNSRLWLSLPNSSASANSTFRHGFSRFRFLLDQTFHKTSEVEIRY